MRKAIISLAISIVTLADIAQASVCPTSNVIQDPTEFQWTAQNGYWSGTLEIGEATLTIGADTLTTRAYRQAGGSYSIPGPTIRMTPGQTYVLTLKNLLPYAEPSTVENDFKDPNITNIHTHGLHVSPMSPADDVLRLINGGYCGDYAYAMPADHMGGTLWYHPHHHGSTYLQVSGGAYGLLLVDDANDGIPTDVAGMTERQLVVGFLDPSVAGTGDDTLISGTLSPTWAVNGKVQGNLCTPANEWQHWRVLLADSNATPKALSVGAGCEVVLLARDGVWRTVAPKELPTNSLDLTGASRADLGVRCSADSNIAIQGTVVARVVADATQPANLTVGPYSNGATGTTWSAQRPEYLRDLDPRVLLPVMVNVDGCFLSFSSELVAIPEQKEVDRFLPAYRPSEIILDPDHPTAEWYLVELSIHRENEIEETMRKARQVIEETGRAFETIFGRKWGLVEDYRCEDARVVLVTLGSATSTARAVVNEFRAQGEALGLLKLRTYRPFPADDILRIAEKAEVLVVVDRNVSHGSGGGCGIVSSEVRSALYDLEKRPKVMSFIAGTGGLDISEDMLRDMAKQALQTTQSRSKGARSATRWVLPDLEKVPQSPPAIPRKAEEKLLLPGLQTCAGCAGTLLFRTAVETIGKDQVMILPFCCVDVGLISMYGDFTPIKVPAFFPCVFAGTASVATGARAGLDRRGKTDTLVVGFAGDGGTVDIGLQSLSGAANRGEPILYICYDNEAYMNTGIQRSGSTPYGAGTATTPASAKGQGNPTRLPKDMGRIMAAHDIPYVATASVAFLKDYQRKLLKAAQVVKNREGMAYIHAHSPCPPGWGYPASQTIEIARLAIQTGLWKLYEIDNGKYRATKTSLKPKPVSEYINAQGRFHRLTAEQLSQLEAQVSREP